MATYSSPLDHAIRRLDTSLHSVPEEGTTKLKRVFDEFGALYSSYQERPTTATYDAAIDKYRDYAVQAAETFGHLRNRIEKLDSSCEEAWDRVRQIDDALIEYYQRRELIRQEKLVNAQLEADVERRLRIYAENEVILEVKRARIAYLEARVAENARRKALGLPLLPRDDTLRR
ncbi:hypothetical protein BC834DRAFT_843435 [Gloeopeniophorella convolvens]|nr:hypothetical protein BC834DRAFT_843435 [Gloeopeniophorella convolvens]